MTLVSDLSRELPEGERYRRLLEAMRTLWENPVQAAEMGVKAEARYRQLFTADEMGRTASLTAMTRFPRPIKIALFSNSL